MQIYRVFSVKYFYQNFVIS